MRKIKKIYAVTIILALIYTVCLFIGGVIVEQTNTLEYNLKKTIEENTRVEQRNFLESIVNKLEYDINKNGIDINNTEAVANWCKYNYSYIRTNKITDGFVIEILSEKLINGDNISMASSNSTLPSCLNKWFDNYNVSEEDINIMLSELKDYKDTDSTDNYTLNNLWLEWKTYPDNYYNNIDNYIDKNGKEKGNNKYIFISTVDSQVILDKYDFAFNLLSSIKIFIFVVFVCFLLSIFIVVCNLTYREFFKEK